MRHRSFSLVFIILLQGCLYRNIRLAGIEPNVTHLKPLPFEVTGSAESEVSSFRLFGTATVTALPDFKAALSEIAASKNGDEVIEVVWYKKRQIWVVGVVDSLIIKAKVIQYKNFEKKATTPTK